MAKLISSPQPSSLHRVSMNWKRLTDQVQLQGIREASRNAELSGIAIFKHSTRCSISSTAKARIERSWNFDETKLPIYYLDLLSYRHLSNQVAAEFDVRHESPQLLVIKNGECVYHASHFGIDPREVEAAVSSD